MDCPSNNIPAYTAYVQKHVKDKTIELISEHKADLNHTIVGAASIIAKVVRDREIAKSREDIGIDFGSGYPSDPKTKEFLAKNWDKYPLLFRKSWASYKKVVQKKFSC